MLPEAALPFCVNHDLWGPAISVDILAWFVESVDDMDRAFIPLCPFAACVFIHGVPLTSLCTLVWLQAGTCSHILFIIMFIAYSKAVIRIPLLRFSVFEQHVSNTCENVRIVFEQRITNPSCFGCSVRKPRSEHFHLKSIRKVIIRIICSLTCSLMTSYFY